MTAKDVQRLIKQHSILIVKLECELDELETNLIDRVTYDELQELKEDRARITWLKMQIPKEHNILKALEELKQVKLTGKLELTQDAN